jgi:beta-lactamase regulating signal transducer with metallopeptidase domain
MVSDGGWAWLESAAAIAVGLAGVVAAAGMMTRRLARGTERRRIWSGAFATLAILLASEATGLLAVLGSWTSPRAEEAARRDLLSPSEGNPPQSGRRTSLGPMPPHPASAPSRAAPPPAGADLATRLVATAWVLGTAAVLLRLAAAHLLLLRFRRRLRPVWCPEIVDRVRGLADRLGIRGVIAVRESPALVCPMIFGLWRPTLVLPAEFDGLLTRPQRDAVLLHELGHVRSWDSRWSVLADVVVAVAWWHPLAWWARSEFRRDIEAAADEASLALDETGPLRLAEGLLRFGYRCAAPDRLAAIGARGVGEASALTRRVRALLEMGPAEGATKGQRWWRRGMLLMLAVAGTALMTGLRPHSPGEGRMGSWNAVWRRSLVGSVLALVAPAPPPAPGALGRTDDGYPKSNAEPRPAPAARADRTEQGAAEAIGLSKRQRDRFEELIEERDARTKAFLGRRPFEPDEGPKINRWWNSELRELFTPEQYKKYVEYWSGSTPRAAAVAAPAAPMRARAVSPARRAGKGEGDAVGGSGKAPDFGAMEDQILAKLGLSELQEEQVSEFRSKLAKMNEEFRELNKTGDGPAIARRGAEINREVRTVMQRILTKDQYKEYVRLWDEALRIGKGAVGEPVAPRRPGGAGVAAPVVPEG